ncbi:hypothetical protein JZY06_10745 [Corynebacterium sp. CCM 8862]|uniref:Uncharacterized protein n=1 Tax=Corynebacterium mendelii TaxID=2765362 RepID=A0A939IY22_9CORY|nr:hypothetical protein [Corynebacterium mendelii]
MPRKIYIRRRVAALVVLIAVVAVIIWIMTLFGGATTGDSQQSGAVETTTTQASGTGASTTSVTPSDQPTQGVTTAPPAETGEQTMAPTTTVVREAPVKNTCQLDDLVVTATTDKSTYSPGEMPKFYMTVSNPTTADCVIDLNDNILRFEVYDLATNRRVWADVDCNSSEGTGTQTFPAGKETYYEAVWSRTESAPGACELRPEAAPGGFYLHALIGSNHSDAKTFNLAPPADLSR